MLNTVEQYNQVSFVDPTNLDKPSSVEIDVLAQLFDFVDYPMLLIKSDGSLVWSNYQGRLALDTEVCVSLADGKIAPIDSNREVRWFDRLADAASGDETLVFVDDGLLGQAISISPLASSGVQIGDTGRSCFGLLVVILGKSVPCEPLALRRFSSRYKLTPAEQRIVAQLLRGLAPGQIASVNQVAVTTVRTQIKSVLAKTSFGSIRDLIIKLSKLPPISMVAS